MVHTECALRAFAIALAIDGRAAVGGGRSSVAAPDERAREALSAADFTTRAIRFADLAFCTTSLHARDATHVTGNSIARALGRWNLETDPAFAARILCIAVLRGPHAGATS